ncbi:MAG: septum formation initiator family protein [Rubrivivax sp.]
MRYLPHVLAALLVLVQADLWFGKGNLRYVMSLQMQLDAQQAANLDAADRNARVQAELSDLVEGLEMVEEHARADLGMVAPDEILVQLTATPVVPVARAASAPRR